MEGGRDPFQSKKCFYPKGALVLFSLCCFFGQLDTSQSSLGDGTLTDGMLPSDWPGGNAWGIFLIND